MIQEFVFPAVSFGLSAAVIPGPLIAYLVNTTLTQPLGGSEKVCHANARFQSLLLLRARWFINKEFAQGLAGGAGTAGHRRADHYLDDLHPGPIAERDSQADSDRRRRPLA